MDINLNGKKSGIEIAKLLSSEYDIPFLFITAHSDVKTIDEALSTYPHAYILKPFNAAEIYSNIKLALSRSQTDQNDFFIYKEGSVALKLPYNTISYMEADGNYADIHTLDKKYVIRNSLDKLSQLLDESIFIRVHRSFIVNINFITRIYYNKLQLKDITIPLSRIYKAKVEDRLS